jgi:predicted AAA+ superfamily ATPase
VGEGRQWASRRETLRHLCDGFKRHASLSGELATRIAGRYVQFRIQTLSFNEFAAFKGGDAKQGRKVSARALFEQYLELGGFPIVAAAGTTPEQSRRLVEDIYNSVVLKDVIARNKIRAPDKLDRLARFVAMNVGNRFSAQSIVNYVKSQSRSMDIDTVYAFLRGLEESCVITKVPRYDVKGKEVLKTQEKYYLADHSLLSALTGSTAGYVGGMLENIVHQELTHRGWKVYVGNGSDAEIDFVALKSGETAFIQVACKLESPRTVEREFRALAKIQEAGEKIVLTMEERFKSPLSGVRSVYLPDWLLKKERTEGYSL